MLTGAGPLPRRCRRLRRRSGPTGRRGSAWRGKRSRCPSQLRDPSPFCYTGCCP